MSRGCARLSASRESWLGRESFVEGPCVCPCVLWIFFRSADLGQPALVLKYEGGGAALVWNPARGVGATAPRVAASGQGARHRRWGSGLPHGSGSKGSLGTGPTKLRGLWRRRAVRRPPKIVAMAQRHAWNPARGVGATAPRVAAGGHGARHRCWGSGFPHGSGSIGSLGTGPTKLGRLGRRRAVRRPPKIVAMAQRCAWGPTMGQGLPRYDSLPAVMKRATIAVIPSFLSCRAPQGL